MLRRVLGALALALVASTAALATGVELVSGQISVNHGNGYQPVVDWVPVSPGDQVMASPDGSGKITYSDGCVVEVKPGAVVTIQEQSPCQSGAGGPRIGYAVVGAIIVGGVVGGVIALSGGGDDDDPSSP